MAKRRQKARIYTNGAPSSQSSEDNDVLQKKGATIPPPPQKKSNKDHTPRIAESTTEIATSKARYLFAE